MSSARGALLAAGLLATVGAYLVMQSVEVPQPRQAITHLNAADHLHQGHSLFEGDGKPGRPYPALYRVALFVAHGCGLSWWQSASMVNAIAFGAGLVMFSLLARELAPRSVPYAMLLYLCFGPHYYLLFSAIPEGVFTTCLLAAAVLSVSYISRPARSCLLLLILVNVLAVHARYMALFTVLPGSLAAIALARPWDPRRVLRHGLSFSVLFGAPFVAWLVRNYRLTGFLSGMARTSHRRAADKNSFLSNIISTLDSFHIDWLRWPGIAQRRYIEGRLDLTDRPHLPALWIGVAVLLTVLAVIAWRRRTRNTPVPEPASDGMHPPARSPRLALGVIVVYLAGYLISLVILWTFTNNDPINIRFVCPAYPLALLLLVALFAWLWRSFAENPGRWLIAALALTLPAFQAIKTRKTWGEVVAEGRAYLYEVNYEREGEGRGG